MTRPAVVPSTPTPGDRLAWAAEVEVVDLPVKCQQQTPKGRGIREDNLKMPLTELSRTTAPNNTQHKAALDCTFGQSTTKTDGNFALSNYRLQYLNFALVSRLARSMILL